MRSSFAASALSAPEPFTPEEAAALAPYFGNTDRPVFVLTNLPEVVKQPVVESCGAPRAARRPPDKA